MKLFTTQHYFDYPWNQVTAANWKKYPNERSTHVIAVDVLRRELDPETKVLTTERLITCKQAIPSWLSFLCGGQDKSYVREVSQVDLDNQTLTMRSNNLTMCNLLSVYETVTYTPDPENRSRTVFRQEAEITAYASIKKICDKVEDWTVERFGQNAITGKLGFESVLKLLTEQWEKSELFVTDVTDSLVNEITGYTEKTSIVINEYTEKTSSVLNEVTEKVKKGVFN